MVNFTNTTKPPGSSTHPISSIPLRICFLRQRSSQVIPICRCLFIESLQVPTSFNDGTLKFWVTYTWICPSFSMDDRHCFVHEAHESTSTTTGSKEPCQLTNHKIKISQVENPAAGAISFCFNKPSGEKLKERSSRSNG